MSLVGSSSSSSIRQKKRRCLPEPQVVSLGSSPQQQSRRERCGLKNHVAAVATTTTTTTIMAEAQRQERYLDTTARVEGVPGETLAAEENKREEIQVDSPHYDDDCATAERLEGMEGCGYQSALTLMNLAMWDAEVTRRNAALMEDVECIQSSLGMLRAFMDNGRKLLVGVGDADLTVTQPAETEVGIGNADAAHAVPNSACEEEDQPHHRQMAHAASQPTTAATFGGALAAAADDDAERHKKVAIDVESL